MRSVWVRLFLRPYASFVPEKYASVNMAYGFLRFVSKGRKENVMAKSFGLAMVLVLGLSLASCATYATRNGVITPIGGLTSANIIEDRPVIASYTVILGLFTVGYGSFLRETEGQDIDIVDFSIPFIFRTIRAVPRSGVE